VFNDQIQGPCEFVTGIDIDDFVLKRRDGYFAYQLAAAVDDQHQGISHVVRGADLLDSSARQIYLISVLTQKTLSPQTTSLVQTTPQYAHIPVLVNARRQKLSKQNLAPALNNQQPMANLLYCLAQLQQPAPDAVDFGHVSELLQWAAENWHPERIPASLAISI